MFFLFCSSRFLAENSSISATIANLHKAFSFQESRWIFWWKNLERLDTQATLPEWFVSETIKALVICYDSKWQCSLRIVYCLESRIRSLCGFVCEVLREKNLNMIFRRKIDQSSWRESNSSWFTKVEGISLKISAIGIQVR